MTTPKPLHRPIRSARRALVALLALIMLAVVAPAVTADPTAAATKPTAAVAVGDSFISGEGAGRYAPVKDRNGRTATFPGWTAANDNAYFCHRSPNASIEVAQLAGIDRRFNISCSGAVTYDIENASYSRDRGRQVASQLDQLDAIADTHDIDLVLLGLGANDIGFAAAATACVEYFLTDAFVPGIAAPLEIFDFFPDLFPDPILKRGDAQRGACSEADFANADEIAQATNDLEDALTALVEKLEAVDDDGEHRIVIQNYVNPMPNRFASEYNTDGGKNDLNGTFAHLARERYAAGCPVHRSSLGLANRMTQALGKMAATAQHRVLLEHPDADIVYLDVMDAFNGAKLCERSGSPHNALHTPVRVLLTNGVPIDSFDSVNYLKDRAENCQKYYQLCQESLHPNAAGHKLLGECLAGASTARRPVVWCNGSGGRVSAMERPATINPNISMRIEEGLDRRGNAILHLNGTWAVKTVDAPGRTISSVSVRFNTGSVTLASRTGTSGAVSVVVPCTGTSTPVYASVTATLDDGSRLNGSSSIRAVCPGQPGGGDQPKR